jgi:hypothetical protein
MNIVLDVLSNAEFRKFALPLSGAVVAWFVNEWRKRIADQYQRKEANYKELLRSLRGFYVGVPKADELKLEFLNQLNLSWLYCPDEVIRKGYAFLDTVHSSQVHSDAQKEAAFGALSRLSERTCFRASLSDRVLLLQTTFVI